MPHLFGTDGIRGLANTPPLTPQEVLRVGHAAGVWFRRQAGRGGAVLVGRDTRRSGPMLEAALVAGLASAGVDAWLGGVLPTPAISFLAGKLQAIGGAVVSASHNPAEDNGIKFFRADGGKLSEQDEEAIETLLADDPVPVQSSFSGVGVGKVSALAGLETMYLERAVSMFPGDRPLTGLRVVCDCADGSASRTTPAALRRLGAQVKAIHCRPDGANINRGCGSLHFDVVARAVKAWPGSLGLTHDGDADRVLMCDEQGELVDGDRMLGLLARDLAERGELPGRRVVGTIMANAGLEEALEPLGVGLERTQVGDRCVADRMRELGAVLGGEPSGHLILSRQGPTGDGLSTALAVLRVVRARQATLSELASLVHLYPVYHGAVRVGRKPPLAELATVATAIESARRGVAPRGRVVVRYSGTEPVARVLVEGPEEGLVRALGTAIVGALRESIGA